MFVYEMGREEKDLTKRQKIDQLQLMDDEWERLGLFNDLLGVWHHSFPFNVPFLTCY